MKKGLTLILLFISSFLVAQTTTPFTSNFDDGTLQGWISNDVTGHSWMSLKNTTYYSSFYSVYYYASYSNVGIRLQDVQSPGVLSFWSYSGTGANVGVFFNGKQYGSAINIPYSSGSWQNYSVAINDPGTGNLDINFLDAYGDFYIDDINCTHTNTFIPIKPWAILLSVIAIGTFLLLSQKKFL